MRILAKDIAGLVPETLHGFSPQYNLGFRRSSSIVSEKVLEITMDREKLIEIIKMYSPASNYQAKEISDAIINSKDLFNINVVK